MKVCEIYILKQINERIMFYLNTNMNKDRIIKKINDFIHDLPEESSTEFLSELCELKNKIKDEI